MRNCVVTSPSRLNPNEIARWRELQRLTPQLHRAFLSPAFSLACEAAGFDARVAVIREGDIIKAYFPFQYRNLIHKWVGLGEAIGGHLSDASGIIAEPGWLVSSAELAKLCGVGAMHINCLADGQPEFGLSGYKTVPNYIVDIRNGYDRYLEDLQARNADFVRDTGRRFRRIIRSLGSLDVQNSNTLGSGTLDRLISEKRAQYKRTNVDDALSDARVYRILEYLVSQNLGDCSVFHTVLTAGGEVVAEHLGLRYFDVLSYWFPVYNYKFQQYSPGRLILWELIKCAPQNGLAVIDFGEGESQYKRQFSNTLISSYKAYWRSGGLQSKVAAMYLSFDWRARSLFRKFRLRVASHTQ